MLTYHVANSILNNLVGRSSLTSPVSSKSYLGLSYTTPERNGSNITEPDSETTGYSRSLLGTTTQSDTFKMTGSTEAETENNHIIYFPKAEIEYPQPVTHFVIFNSETGSAANNVLAYGELKAPIKPNINEVPLVERGDLILAIDKDLNNE